MAFRCCNLNYLNILVILTLYGCTFTNAIVNTKIDRVIDLSSQLVKIVDRIHVEDDNVHLYRVKIDESHRDNLAYIEVTHDGKRLETVERTDGTYEVDLGGKTTKPLVVVTVYTKILKPYPAEISQSERQLVKYDGTQTALSPYLTRTATTKIKLPLASRLESFTKAAKITTGTNKLTYGPFKDLQPDQAEPLSVHFENNSPFVATTNLVRTVEVSAWTQSISIVNNVKVSHVGAKLKGSFSRFDYQRDDARASVRSFAAVLPRSAKDIYYRDGIGNISTSNVRTTSTSTLVNLKPRFPLFGGWVTDFILGYKVPASEFLNGPATGNNYRLSIPFADFLYENMFIEDATIRITLPAGSSNIQIKGSIEFERLKDEISYSYLDVIGRPVVNLRKMNIVAQHLEGHPLVIRYDYSKAYMAQEPILLLGAAIFTMILTTLYSILSSKSSSSAYSNKLKSE